jgi:small-conductance mechanosensitive channel
MMTFWEWTYLGNTMQSWVIAVVVAVAVFVGLRIFVKILSRRLTILAEKTRTDLDDLLVELIRGTRFFFLLVVALYAGLLVLKLPEAAARLASSAAVIGLLGQAAVWGNQLISFWINRYMKRKADRDAASATTLAALGFISKLLLWSVVLLLALDNIGVDITALVAGLGVGGIAVALAVQNILGDLFASLSIVLDKPFVIGDFIIIGDYMGTIEHVGLKTTRIRSLSGEQLVFSNTDLLQSRIRNFKRMYERRVLFSIGVVYQTPYDKLVAIPQIIREIIEAQESTRFDRAHFKEYGDFSLNFEIVYWVQSPDYNVYMDIHQAINLELYRRFEAEGIEFAYPTQTVFISKETNSAPLADSRTD